MKAIKFVRNALFVTMTLTGASNFVAAQSTTEVLHFRSEAQGKVITFDWSVAENDGIRAFGVERAGADLRFETIGTVAVRPTERTSATYRFTDSQPLAGAAFYRLKVMNHTGNVQYCKVIGQTTMTSANRSR